MISHFGRITERLDKAAPLAEPRSGQPAGYIRPAAGTIRSARRPAWRPAWRPAARPAPARLASRLHRTRSTGLGLHRAAEHESGSACSGRRVARGKASEKETPHRRAGAHCTGQLTVWPRPATAAGDSGSRPALGRGRWSSGQLRWGLGPRGLVLGLGIVVAIVLVSPCHDMSIGEFILSMGARRRLLMSVLHNLEAVCFAYTE